MKNLFLLLLFVTVFSSTLSLNTAQAQTSYGGTFGNSNDTWVINDDRTNVFSALRLQTSTDKAFLLSNKGTSLNYYYSTSTNNWTDEGTHLMSILSNGNVGIGTASPALKLDVRGGGAIGLINRSVWDHMYMFHDGSNAFFRAGGAEDGLAFQVNGGGSDASYGGQTYTEAMRLLGNGNVGIGTTTPTAKLSFDNNLGAKINLWGNGTTNMYGFGISGYQLNYHVDGVGSSHVFYAGGNSGNGIEIMRIKGNGNVGIGTSSPNYKLHINGDTRIENGFSMGGGNDFKIDADGVVGGRFTVLSNGNVGIGTTSPELKLDIRGDGSKIGLANTAPWDHMYMFHDGATAFFRAGGAESGLAFQVSEYGSGPYGGQIYNEAMRILGNGNVGIGTTSPSQKLHVAGNGYFTGTMGVGTAPVSDIAMKVKGSFNVTNSSDKTVFHVSSGKQLVFVGDSAYIQYQATLSNPNSVIQENNFSLWVSKGIVTQDLAIESPTDWSDFVFEKEYELRSLEEVAAYIKTNGHLPEMPSEAAIKAQGYSVHDINKKLLQKIEELTLYSIQQENKLKAQAAQLEAQQKQYNNLEQRIKQLEDKQ